jgi:methionyl-tRNA formyltransferase
MKVIFMGTPAFAVPTLKELLRAGHDVVAVYSQPPKPAGRGQQERKSPVQELAEAEGLIVETPASLKDPATQQQFKNYGAEAAVVAAYGLLLPPAILDACPLGCINVHPSLLPRWRGAAPIQRALMAGDKETGVCIMQMDEGLDTGAILHQAKLPIPEDMTAGELHDMLAEMGATMVTHTLSNRLSALPQAMNGATYAKKISKEDCRIDWTKRAREIKCLIHGLSPMPGAFFPYKGEAIKVFRARVMPNPSRVPAGTVLDDRLSISCGEGVIQLLMLQRPGKKPMEASEFLRGFAIPAKTMLA